MVRLKMGWPWLWAGLALAGPGLALGWPWLWAGLALGWLALSGLWAGLGWSGLPLPVVEARP